MDWKQHASLTGTALKRWFIAQSYDALAVGILWWIGLTIIGIWGAPFWAILGGAFQFVPNIGAVLALIGPSVIATLSWLNDDNYMRLVYVLILYAVIAATDGLFLQPYLMKRTVRVPIWASILAPLVMGLLFNFVGVLLSAPLLAILYTYKARKSPPPMPPPAPPAALS
jgi:predicted PurR-regulated permease PerM